MIYLSSRHKHFKIGIINMFRNLKEPVLKMMKGSYDSNEGLSNQRENIKKDIDIIKEQSSENSGVEKYNINEKSTRGALH